MGRFRLEQAPALKKRRLFSLALCSSGDSVVVRFSTWQLALRQTGQGDG